MGALVPLFLVGGFLLLIVVLFVATFWKLYEKAGQPGWAAIVPYYGYGLGSYVLVVEVCKQPPVWFWLQFVPCANIVCLIFYLFVIPFKVAEQFGKDTGFGVGLMLLPIVFYPILAFGDAQYQGGRRRYDDDYDDEDDYDDRPRKKKRDDNW